MLRRAGLARDLQIGVANGAAESDARTGDLGSLLVPVHVADERVEDFRDGGVEQGIGGVLPGQKVDDHQWQHDEQEEQHEHDSEETAPEQPSREA